MYKAESTNNNNGNRGKGEEPVGCFFNLDDNGDDNRIICGDVEEEGEIQVERKSNNLFEQLFERRFPSSPFEVEKIVKPHYPSNITFGKNHTIHRESEPYSLPTSDIEQSGNKLVGPKKIKESSMYQPGEGIQAFRKRQKELQPFTCEIQESAPTYNEYMKKMKNITYR